MPGTGMYLQEEMRSIIYQGSRSVPREGSGGRRIDSSDSTSDKISPGTMQIIIGILLRAGSFLTASLGPFHKTA